VKPEPPPAAPTAYEDGAAAAIGGLSGARSEPETGRMSAWVELDPVLAALPVGVVVLDLAGRAVAHNPAARSILGIALDRPRARCCDLFGCRRPGTPLAHCCLTVAALGPAEPLPEARVDLPARNGGAGGAWVTAVRAGGPEAAIVVQLRAAARNDRRRRTQPGWAAGSQLRIYALGRTRLEAGGIGLAGDWLAHRPGELLKYLVVERGRTVQIEEMLEVFWPDGVRTNATNVRQAIHTLRDRLEPTRAKRRPSAFVVARRGGYELDRERVWLDVDEFEASATTGLRALARGDAEAAKPELVRAAALYRGDFLADEPYAEWALAERDRLRHLAAQVLRRLSALRIGLQDLEGALDALQRLADLEPYDELAQKELLSMLLRHGRHAEARRRYQVVSHRFRRAFGSGPDFALTQLRADT
jgi:DNA-binding SARP family transcriptional activator